MCIPFVKIARDLQDHPLWKEKPFSRGQAWVDLVLMASYKDGAIRRRGIKVKVLRGEIGYSLRELAEKWGWSLGKVQRYIDELKSDKQIDTRTDTEGVNVTTVLCLVNYEKFQSNGTENDTENDTEKKQKVIRKRYGNDTETGTDKEVKEVKERKEETMSADSFEEFWGCLPSRAKRCGKAGAKKSWDKHVNGNAAEVISSVRSHMQSADWVKENGKFIPMITSWINQHRWTAPAESLDISRASAACTAPYSQSDINTALRARKVVI